VKGALGIQYLAGRLAVFVLAPLYFGVLKCLGYRIDDLGAVRKKWREISARHRGPWVLCANHLTLIDSMVITYGLFSLKDHFTSYRAIPWNLPERRNFRRNPVVAALCYLAKCIFVLRGGGREEMKKTLESCLAVLGAGQNILIFPEGGRSRSGRVEEDNFSYGVGRLVLGRKDCRVACIYLRGRGQETYSAYPRLGERFTMNIETVELPETGLSGLRAQREAAAFIVSRLRLMEEDYFSRHRQRYRGSEGESRQGGGWEIPRAGLHRG